MVLHWSWIQPSFFLFYLRAVKKLSSSLAAVKVYVAILFLFFFLYVTASEVDSVWVFCSFLTTHGPLLRTHWGRSSWYIWKTKVSKVFVVVFLLGSIFPFIEISLRFITEWQSFEQDPKADTDTAGGCKQSLLKCKLTRSDGWRQHAGKQWRVESGWGWRLWAWCGVGWRSWHWRFEAQEKKRIANSTRVSHK